VADVGARIYRSTAQSIPNDTQTLITFDTARWDTNNHWSAAQPNRLFCRQAGKYLATLTIRFTGNIAGNRIVFLNQSGVGTVARADTTAAFRAFSLSSIISMAVGSHLSVTVYQSSGAALNIEPFTPDSSELSFQLLS